MAQAPITSFFDRKRTSKKPIDVQKKPRLASTPASGVTPEVPKLESESSVCAASELKDYAHGAANDPNFLHSESNKLRHEKFMMKLGKPRHSKYASENEQARHLKPFDEQYIDIKKRYPDTILIVEVGYKYKILGKDAQIAAQQFGWALMPGWLNIEEGDPVDALYDRFASCSFPVARLHFYIQKLINSGYKVGVVGQLETSALKAVGDNRRGPFKREVTAVYTRGTYIADTDLLIKDTGDNLTGHISAIATDEERKMTAFVSVQPSTGELVWDLFQDSDMAIELETRLLHVQPCEIILLSPVTSVTKKLAGAVAARGRSVRVSDASRVDTQAVFSTLKPFLEFGMAKLLEPRSEALGQCASILVRHLAEFDLTDLFLLPQCYSHFSSSSRMLLNGGTLSALEVFENSTNHTTQGSLFAVMDQTQTDFGRRLMRKWIAQPLLNRESLQARIDAASELISNYCDPISRLHKLLPRLPDLEKVLIQIHYGRIGPKQLWYGLQHFYRISSAYTPTELTAAGLKSALLGEYFYALCSIREQVESWNSFIDPVGAQNGIVVDFFKADDSCSQHQGEISQNIASVFAHKHIVAELHEQFEIHRAELEKSLKIPIKLVDNNGESNLLEISQKNIKSVPADWKKHSGTKLVARFRSSYSLKLLREVNVAQETLQLVAKQAFDKFVAVIRAHYSDLRHTVVSLANIDCLMSLARLSSKPGYTPVDFIDEPCIDIDQGRHPMIDELISDDYIPNDVRMFQNNNRVMIVTGPNMGGKSSFSRQVALICLMAQIGSSVPAAHARLSLLDAIYTRMGAYDNIMRGESSFQVELKECSDILARATPRSLVILDEVGRGTSTTDGMAIAYAVLEHLITSIKCFCLFITHYSLLTEIAAEHPSAVKNWSMEFAYNADKKTVTFLYVLTRKPAYRSYGLNVARLAGLPEKIIAVAEQKSADFENELLVYRQAHISKSAILSALAEPSEAAVSGLKKLDLRPAQL